MKIDQKFRNGLWLFVQEQNAIVFKNNRLLFFLLFYNLKILKQCIKMQFFFPNGLWRLLKNGLLPFTLDSSAPPGLQSGSFGSSDFDNALKSCHCWMVSRLMLSIEFDLAFGFLHSLESFVLDLLKLILTETILVIKKAYARAYLPGLYKIFLLCLFGRTPGFLV